MVADCSVIIPALNEEEHICDTLRHVRQIWPEAERIVVDGGSTDNTVRLATPLARIVTSSSGRGLQMNAGARAAGGNLLLFLHADSRLPADAKHAVLASLAAGIEAGAFRLRFSPSTAFLSVLARVSHLPWPSICFGDRGLFVRHDVFDELGGYAEWPLFEDVDLATRLHKRGRFRFLKEVTATSPRRFLAAGPVRHQLLNTALWLAYRAGADPNRLVRHYTR